MSRIGIVVIGRNEGERLKRCLRSLPPRGSRIVYVDSGSQDDSVAHARGLGLEVVALDPGEPFTAARARNAGFEALVTGGNPDHVQFIDGDCAMEPGWIEAAGATLDQDPSIGIVTGWLNEVSAERNVYHAMCQVEWRRPAGDIAACGGIMMVRAEAFRAAGGFDPGLIAGEDEEFCLRVAGRTGLRVHRIPRIMAHHDVDISGLWQWWRRNVRTGHAFAQMSGFHPTHFRRERLRAWAYGLILPVVALLAALVGQWWLVGLALLGLGANWLRTAHGLKSSQGLSWARALQQAAYLVLSKLANLHGMMTYHVRRWRRAGFWIIEHK